MEQTSSTGIQIALISEQARETRQIDTCQEEGIQELEDIKENDLLEHQSQIKCILAYAIVTMFLLLCIAVILIFILFPVIFANSIALQRLLMFTNIGLPKDHKDFDALPRNPHLLLNNFYVKFLNSENKTISLGTWFLLCYSLYPNDTKKTEIDYDGILRADKADVLIYFHGSGESRKDPIPMYRVLRHFFHIIAFDYRDYGDSTPAELNEAAIAADSIHVFAWVKARTRRKVYVWGHSLGAPLCTLTIKNLPPTFKPHGLVLESAMTNMHDEIAVHPYGKLFSWLPWFRQTVQDPLEINDFLFATDTYILHVECPILILHAEDDSIVPYTLGKKLANIAINKRSKDKGNVIYVQFPARFHYDHFRIFHSEILASTIIPNFTETCDEYYNKTHNKGTISE